MFPEGTKLAGVEISAQIYHLRLLLTTNMPRNVTESFGSDVLWKQSKAYTNEDLR